MLRQLVRSVLPVSRQASRAISVPTQTSSSTHQIADMFSKHLTTEEIRTGRHSYLHKKLVLSNQQLTVTQEELRTSTKGINASDYTMRVSVLDKQGQQKAELRVNQSNNEKATVSLARDNQNEQKTSHTLKKSTPEERCVEITDFFGSNKLAGGILADVGALEKSPERALDERGFDVGLRM